jgi:hypothetical protein
LETAVTLRPLRSTWILFVGLSVSVGCGRAPEPVETARPPEPTPVASPAELAEDTIVGVKIYRTERELPALFEEWQGLGINAVFSGEELTSTGGFRALARSNELELFVIFPVFFAPEVLAQESDLWAMTADGELAKEDWVEFVCPSRPEFP